MKISSLYKELKIIIMSISLNSFIAVLSILLFTTSVRSQDNAVYSEKIYLQTDRDYYISGEEILFKAYLKTGSCQNIESKILYIELANVKSEILQKKAFYVNNNTVQGVFEVPDSISSGSFELTAFTNWHLNFDNNFAFKKNLIIVNRFGQYGNVQNIDFAKRASQNSQQFKQEIEINAGVNHNYSPFKLNVKLDKPGYKTRQLVQLSLQLDSSDVQHKSSNLSVSVYVKPKEVVLKNSRGIEKWMSSLSEVDRDGGNNTSNTNILKGSKSVFDVTENTTLKYPVETYGKIIFGQVIDKKSGNAIAGA